MENIVEQTNIKNMNRNKRIFPIYKMLAWDLLFYYAISFLFLTEVKGFSASNVLLLDVFFTLAFLLFQIPCTVLIDKLGKKNALIFGNILVSLYILMVIVFNNYNILIIANIIWGFGYLIKEVCETDILFDSIPRSPERGEKFSKIDGKGSSYYYYLEAFSCLVTGLLYVVNPYIPMILCLICCILSSYLATKFENIIAPKNTSSQFTTKVSTFSKISKYLKELKYSFRFIFKSKRLKSLLLFYGVFSGILTLLTTYRKSLLADLDISATYFGIIFAVLGLLAAISSKYSAFLNRKFKNRTLAIISISTLLSMIFAGIVVVINVPIIPAIIFIFIMFAIQHLFKGPFYSLGKQYLGNFSTHKIRTKILMASDLVTGIFKSLIILVGSFFLEITSTAYASIIFGCILTLIIIAILEYMKTRIGLKPEQYKKSDIEFTELK